MDFRIKIKTNFSSVLSQPSDWTNHILAHPGPLLLQKDAILPLLQDSCEGGVGRTYTPWLTGPGGQSVLRGNCR